MSERGDQVQRLLASLAKHSDLIADAFDGPVTGGDKSRNQGIESLFSLGVLKPYDEDAYRLHPRLREFFADHFASYYALQALRQVTGTVAQAREQAAELVRLHKAGAARDADRLYAALDESVVDIAYSIENNLAMLHSLLSTQYGNVDDLGSKLRQNRYYARQVARFLREVQNIDTFVENTAEDAVAAGLPQVRHLVTRRLGARCLNWTSQIKDAQAVISKRLFEARLLEEKVKRIARFSLWLTRHKTTSGWDLAVDENSSPTLFRPERFDLRPQPDVADTDPAALDGLIAASLRMPPALTPAPPPADPGPQMLIQDDDAIVMPPDPVQEAIAALISDIRASTTAVSLGAWKRSRRELDHISEEVWLLFAYMQLTGSGLDLSFDGPERVDPFHLNEIFRDVRAQRSLIEFG